MKPALLKFVSAIIAISILGAITLSCKKDKTDSSPYFVQCNIDGVKLEFRGETEVMGVISFATNVHSVHITALDEPADMTLQLYSTNPISARTYNGFTFVSGNLIGCVVGYSPDGFVTYISESDLPDDPVIIIEEITNQHIKGKFHGTIYSSGRPTLEVTEGEFFVKLIDSNS
jgi:hypothetical protein